MAFLGQRCVQNGGDLKTIFQENEKVLLSVVENLRDRNSIEMPLTFEMTV